MIAAGWSPGAVTLNVLIWGGATLLGYADLTQRFPELSALVIALTLSMPMAAWMRLRGHDWHHTIEMSGATALVGVLLIGGFWLGVISQHGLIEWQIRLVCPVMVAVMLLRAGFYSQTHTAHRSTAHAIDYEEPNRGSKGWRAPYWTTRSVKQVPQNLCDRHSQRENDQSISDAALLAWVIGQRPINAA